MKTRFVFLTSVLLGVYFLFYFLLQIVSVHTVLSMVGQNSNPETQRAIEKQFHLDLPAWQRLAIHLNDISPCGLYSVDTHSPLYNEDVLQQSFCIASFAQMRLLIKLPYLGRSFQNQELVHRLLLPRLTLTLLLALSSMLIATLLGLALGTLSALHYSKWVDRLISFFTSLGVSLPSFFIAIILSLAFGYYLSDFTGLSFKGSFVEYEDQGQAFFSFRNLVLPVFALTIRPLAIITQMMRTAMLDVLKEDYIRAAQAKGLSTFHLMYKHAIPNALNPVVSSIAGWLGSLLTGTYFIEMIFDIKGLGYITIQSILKFDTPVILGASLYIALIFVLVSWCLDSMYRYLDPRLRT